MKSADVAMLASTASIEGETLITARDTGNVAPAIVATGSVKWFDGTRGFGFTGADIHQSWSYESQRKLVLNGILWTAKLPVPPDGVSAKFDPQSLQRNLDDKRPAKTSK